MNHSELVAPVLHCKFRTCSKIVLVRIVILFFYPALVCVIWCTITISVLITGTVFTCNIR